MVAIVVFLMATIGLVMLADFATREDQRRTDAVVLADVYRAIVGDPSNDRFGYLGDVGDYPTELKDLIQVPGLEDGVPGWNGPYISDAYLDLKTFYDSFGTPIEFFLQRSPGSLDKLAMVSKGPDHTSSNTASNPNDSAQFSSPFPSDGAAYLNAAGNADNLAYPDFSTSAAAVDYQDAGKLQDIILNKDTNLPGNPVVGACPLLYSLVVTSASRGSADTITLAYSPGLSLEFVQGLYNVSITSSIIQRALFSQSVAIYPGRTTTHTLRAGDFDSGATPTFRLFVTNNTSSAIYIKRFGVVVGVGIVGAGVQNQDMGMVKVCGNMTAETALVGGSLIDNWAMPWGMDSTRVIGSAYNTLTVTNLGTSTARRHLQVIRDGVLLGTVYRRKVGDFPSIPNGAAITIRNQTGALVTSFTMGTSPQSVSY
jgi:hypothetical protein